jgi:hypothetical protein
MATYKDVTDTIKFFVEFDGVFKVNKEDMVVSVGSDGKEEYVYVDGIVNGTHTKSKLILFKENISSSTDATILNPFAEGIGQTSAQDWFYHSKLTTFTYKLVSYMRAIMELALEQKEEDKPPKLPNKLLERVSKFIDRVDKKAIQEFEKITDNYIDFFSVYFPIKDKKAKAICGLFNGPGFRDKYKDVRKKSWSLFSDIFCDLMDIDPSKKDEEKMESFICSMKSVKIPRLSAMIDLWGLIYETTNPKFELIDKNIEGGNIPFAIDFDKYKAYADLDHLKECYDVAKNILSVGTKPTISQQKKSKVRHFGVPSPNDGFGIGPSNVPSPDNFGDNMGWSSVPSPNDNFSSVPSPTESFGDRLSFGMELGLSNRSTSIVDFHGKAPLEHAGSARVSHTLIFK